jgi:uncharacterized protein (TIGR03086 family)
MATDLPEAHAAALDKTRGFVSSIGAGQWSGPTPCEDWDVRTLVNHIVTGNFWAAELGDGKTIDEVGDRLDGDVLGDDPTAVYVVSQEDAAAVFRAPGAMERPCAVSYGPVPGEIYCGHRLLDVLIHGWDVAKATGQDTTLPADLVDVCLFEVVEPQAEQLVASGMFATDVDAGGSNDRQVQLLAMLGRRP